jgi:hypothetical protein
MTAKARRTVPEWLQPGSALSLAAMVALEESGFVVLPGPFVVDQLGMVANAYDAEVSAAVAIMSGNLRQITPG